MPDTITNRDRFEAALTDKLKDLFANDNRYIAVQAAHTPYSLAAKLTDGLIDGTAMHDGPAIVLTCKTLRIKRTYSAIRDYLTR